MAWPFEETKEQKNYRLLIGKIRSSNLPSEITEFLAEYVSEVRDGKRTNDFFDFELLQSAIEQTLDSGLESREEILQVFNSMIDRIGYLLPQGTKTKDFELIKEEIIIYHFSIEKLNIFDEKFYLLFDDRNDYLRIMNIIMKDEKLINNFSKIVDFSLAINEIAHDSRIVKGEILLYLEKIDTLLAGDEEYLKEKIKYLEMSYGIYPGITQANFARMARKIEQGEVLAKRLDSMEQRVDEYTSLIAQATADGQKDIADAIEAGQKKMEAYANSSIKQFRADLEVAKKELKEELDKFLITLKQELQENSNEIFSQLLAQSQEKLNNLRVIATSISGATTQEVLRVRREAEDSLQKLKDYVETSPDLKHSMDLILQSDEVKNALLKFVDAQKNVNASEAGLVLPTGGIVVPTNQVVVPVTDEETINFMVPKFKMTDGLLHAFDQNIPYNEREARIRERADRLEKKGLFVPTIIWEALPWYLNAIKYVYLYGPTQSGKTTAAKLMTMLVAEEEDEYDLLDGDQIEDKFDITSFNNVDGKFDENSLFYALYYGKTVLYDEVDNSNTKLLVVLGKYMSKLSEKVEHPERDICASFAKRRQVPINGNARMLLCGNTDGRGRTKEHQFREPFEEATLERIVLFETNYDTRVERKIFGVNVEWFDFFLNFRQSCVSYARINGGGYPKGNVTTSDATAIVNIIKQHSMSVIKIMQDIFVQQKEAVYLENLANDIAAKYRVKTPSSNEMTEIDNTPLEKLTAEQLAQVFLYTAKLKLDGEILLTKVSQMCSEEDPAKKYLRSASDGEAQKTLGKKPRK